MGNTRGILVGLLALASMALVPCSGQATNAAPAGSATNAAPAAPAPVPLADVITDAMADSSQSQQIQQQVESDQTAATVKDNLPVVAGEIERRESEDRNLLGKNPSLSELRTAGASWQMLSNSLAESSQSLASRLALLDSRIAALGQMNVKWQATLTASAGAPSAVLDRIHAVMAQVAQATQAATVLRTQLLSLQSSVAGQDAQVSSAIAAIKKAQTSAVNLLFTRDSAPVWDFHGLSASPGAAATSFSAQAADVRAYILEKYPTFFIHVALFLVFAVVLFWVRNELRRNLGEDPEVRQAATVFEVPVATALLLALLISGWLYPLPPPLFVAGLGAAAILPTVLILRRLVEPALYPVLYALLVSYFVDQVRLVVTDSAWTARSLFLAEMVVACVFLAWLFRSKELRHKDAGASGALLEQFVRIYAGCALVLMSAALAANILGYVRLSSLVGNALLKSSYLLIILYAAVRIADGLLIGALKLPPFSLLNMVRHHYALLRGRVYWTLRAAAFLFWLWEALEIFSVRTPLTKAAARVLTHEVHFGSVALSLAPLLCFGLTIWATVLLSKFLRFFLEEEVYPKLSLGRGVPYASSTLVHYTVLVLGSIFALATMGIDLRQYSVLAGALGVGLGFGLQNIMNNFVSGIILLFERPIKVGDVIQVDTSIGTVESIGIRASVIRITNGSELILPNGNLISNPVTNWTFSNRQRVIDLPVAVVAKSDPRQVMAILVETAKAHPLVLKDPPPQVLLTNISGASLNFELRSWTANNEGWMQVRSDLALAISAALARENIAMS